MTENNQEASRPQPFNLPRPPVRPLAAGLLISAVLAAVKIITGLVGQSFALVADGIESVSDIVTTIIVWSGISVASMPPDEKHPYGHGRAESLATFFVVGALLFAVGVIAIQSYQEIRNPHAAPAWFTLPVLALVIVVKWSLSRFIGDAGAQINSTAMAGDALHHLSDAITSAAAFVGITIALIGGPGWEAADDWAALVACGVILWNAAGLTRRGLDDIMDATPVNAAVENDIRGVVEGVEGVLGTEKLRVRKSGMGFLMDIHVEVDPEISVYDGHEIAKEVKNALLRADLGIVDVLVHIEPFERV